MHEFKSAGTYFAWQGFVPSKSGFLTPGAPHLQKNVIVNQPL